MGPTAAGKTAAAVDLVENFPFEIISVDSALVYRGLNIGTAKPDRQTLARAPHRLIDIVEPNESYSAGRFARDAAEAVREIRAAGRVPLFAGGTLLYFRAYAEGLASMPRASARIREEIDATAVADGWPALHRELASVDPVAAGRIHPNDAQRIQRALEVYRQTGTPISDLQQQRRVPGAAETFYRVAWCPSRSNLYQNCETRLNHMIKQDFISEVRDLFERGDLHPQLPAVRAVGYRQFWQHLQGECSRDEAGRRALVATRRLAKRQLTWLRAEPGVVWIDPNGEAARQQLHRLARRVVRAARYA